MMRLGVSISTLTLLVTSAFAQHPKIARGLETLDQNSVVDVIVQYTHVPTERHYHNVLAKGGALKNKLQVIKSGHYAIPVRALRDLAEDPDVVHISPDRELRAAIDVAENAVNANIAFSYGDRKSVV